MKKSSRNVWPPLFYRRLFHSILLASIFVLSSLFLGMWGYHYFEKLSWLDAYVSASMILAGMGPIEPPKTDAGKFFEGTYALFSGIIFLISVGLILAPLFHHLFHKFKIEESGNEKNRGK